MNESASNTAISIISAMVTPALLILGTASLVASALVRMARIVDRARVLAAAANEGVWEKYGVTPAVLRRWLDQHAARARVTERAIALLYAAIVIFIATPLTIVLDRAVSGRMAWLPITLAIVGTLVLLGGSTGMVVESRMSGDQIQEEIRLAQIALKERPE